MIWLQSVLVTQPSLSYALLATGDGGGDGGGERVVAGTGDGLGVTGGGRALWSMAQTSGSADAVVGRMTLSECGGYTLVNVRAHIMWPR
mmetsp:Transcript_49954/g.114548  ORF Transcript_49954/g.114548 Transcript_49954/m.114548 type:complete len:89 (+) Transcript_49954:284-550(+)